MGACVSYLLHLRNEQSIVDHSGIAAMEKFLLKWNVPTTEGSDTESPVYRSILGAREDPKTNWNRYYNCTLVQALRESCRRNADQDAAGIRPIDHVEKTMVEDPKTGRKRPWECVHFKPTVKYSYAQLWEMITSLAEGFKRAGITKGMMVGIYEDTRLEWLLSAYALWMVGAVGVTVYANLGADALAFAIKEAEVKYIILNGKLVQNIIDICKRSDVPIPYMIVTDKVAPAAQEAAQKENIQMSLWVDVHESGKKAVAEGSNTVEYEPKPDDLALIMYTSGTTGDPKGVVLTHGNVHAAVQLVSERVGMIPEGNSREPDATPQRKHYVAFLPLAHILEFVAENIMYLRGWYVGYGSARTLVNATAKPHGDLQEFNPFLFVGVPRIFDNIKKVIEGQIPSGIKRAVFDRAFRDRLQALQRGKDTLYYNRTVFDKSRRAFGDKCQCILSGGAPMSARAQQFMMVVCCAPVVQGYGLTEVCAAISTQLPWDMHTDEVGALFNGVEVKLRESTEYNPPEDSPTFVGEILVRGPPVARGYYKQLEKTQEVFLPDGFFATGDVGTFVRGTNNLKIIGRCKALAKTAHGEYIALEALESVYVLDPLVTPNGVCVLVNSEKGYISALVNTEEQKAMRFAKEHGIPGKWPDILLQRNFNEAAAESLAATARANGRQRFELVKFVRVVADDWSVESGLMTAAHKIKRAEIEIKYKAIINEIFAEDDAASTLI